MGEIQVQADYQENARLAKKRYFDEYVTDGVQTKMDCELTGILGVHDSTLYTWRKESGVKSTQVAKREFVRAQRPKAMADPDFGLATGRARIPARALGRRYNVTSATISRWMEEEKIRPHKEPTNGRALANSQRITRALAKWGRPEGMPSISDLIYRKREEVIARG